MSEELYELYDAGLDTHPYRIAMETYRKVWGLAAQEGFDTSGHGPLLVPGRALLLREQQNMMARHKQNPKTTPTLAKIKTTGILDAPTRAVLIPPVPWGVKVGQTGLSQVGVHEEPWGSNTGPMIREYQAAAGNAFYEPWCACFVSWALKENGYTGRVSARAWDWADIGTLISSGHANIDKAQEGDIVPFNIGDGHVGIYLSHTSSMVKTVDGNTSDQVAVRERPLSIIRAITRHGR